MNYLSDKITLELEEKGYTGLYKYGGKSFGYLNGLEIAKRLRKDGFYARVFAVAMKVRDCPNFMIFYKEKRR